MAEYNEKEVRIRNVIDTEQNWLLYNPVLLRGEIGFAIKTGNQIAYKIGDGNTAWVNLPYSINTASEITAMVTNLQNQIDAIVTTSASGGDVAAEVSQSRVGADGTAYQTLKQRLDAEYNALTVEQTNLKKDLNEFNSSFNDFISTGFYKNDFAWELGGYNQSTPVEQNYRGRTVDYVDTTVNLYIKNNNPNNYKYLVIYFSEDGTYINDTGWMFGEVVVNSGSKIKLLVAKKTEDYNPNTFNLAEASTCVSIKKGTIGNGVQNFRWLPVDLDFTLYPNKRFKGDPPNGYVNFSDESSINFCATRIEVKQGEKYRIRGYHYYQAQCYALTDSNDKVIKKETGSGSVFTVFEEIEILTSNAKWLYISGYGLQYVQKWGSVSTDLSPLHNKKIVYNGDSICATHINNNTLRMNGGGFAKLIQDKTGCDFFNEAVDGSIVRAKEGSGTNYHSVVDSIVNLPTDADIYCYEGGINDYWTRATLGTFSKSDYTSDVDVTTFCGALEQIFRYSLEHFLGKQIFFVIVHKVTTTAYTQNAMGNTFEDYHNAIVGICEKYGIPYYDAFMESGLNGWNSYQNNAYLTANSAGTGDGTHPNKDGYLKYYVPQLIAKFESLVLP